MNIEENEALKENESGSLDLSKCNSSTDEYVAENEKENHNEIACENETSSCVVSGDPTALIESELTPEELEAKEKEAYEKAMQEQRKKRELYMFPQLRSRNVPEDRLFIFVDIMDKMGRQSHTGFTAMFVHNLIALGVNDGWEKLEEVLNESLEREANDPEKDGSQTRIVSDIRELTSIIISNNMDAVEIDYLLKFIRHQPIVPLTGADDEWMPCYGDETREQNKICTAVFRMVGDNTTADYLYANTYTSDGGLNWFTGNSGIINSTQPITFPFTVPDMPNKIYVEEITDNEYIDITGDEERIKFLREYYTEVEKYNGAALTFAEACAKVNKDTEYISVLTDQNITISTTNKGIEIYSDKEGNTIEIDRFTRFVAHDISVHVIEDTKDEPIEKQCDKDLKTCGDCEELTTCPLTQKESSVDASEYTVNLTDNKLVDKDGAGDNNEI